MATDWIPCFNWGAEQTVVSGTTTTAPLLDPTQYDTIAEVTGRVDMSPKKLKILRIVGQFGYRFISNDAYGAPLAGTLKGMVLTVCPGLINSAGTTTGPGPGPTTSDYMNQRVWAVRMGPFPYLLGQDWFDPYEFPGWGMMDIRPKQWVEPPEAPITQVYNGFLGSPTYDVRFVHWWRMLVAY